MNPVSGPNGSSQFDPFGYIVESINEICKSLVPTIQNAGVVGGIELEKGRAIQCFWEILPGANGLAHGCFNFPFGPGYVTVSETSASRYYGKGGGDEQA